MAITLFESKIPQNIIIIGTSGDNIENHYITDDYETHVIQDGENETYIDNDGCFCILTEEEFINNKKIDVDYLQYEYEDKPPINIKHLGDDIQLDRTKSTLLNDSEGTIELILKDFSTNEEIEFSQEDFYNCEYIHDLHDDTVSVVLKINRKNA